MNDFIFQNPTKVFFGKNQIMHLHNEVLKFGNKVLVVAGGNTIRNSTLYEQVLVDLKLHGICVFEFDTIEPNPRHTTVNRGTRFCKKYGIQSILAIGGGSAIDCSKAIAATALSKSENFWDLVEKKVEWHEALPVIAIPTIASTGSEMDRGCVITNINLGIKRGISGESIRPKVAFLDPINTFSVPPKQTACGGFDIIAHLLDMNYFVNSIKYPLQFNVVETILKTVFTYLPIAIHSPENYEARATLLWSASWSLNSFCTSGFKTQASLHALEQFSSTLDMTHGLGLALIAPKWMAFLLNRDESVADDFARFGINVLGIDKEGTSIEIAQKTIYSFQEFIVNELHLPQYLWEIGEDGTYFNEMANKALKGLNSLPHAYRELTKGDCLKIYEMCL